jgi:hypothetical protein
MKKVINGVETIVDFQAPETVAAIRAKYKLTQDVQKKVSEAKRRLHLVATNTAAVELQGKSPSEEFRNATLAVEAAEQEHWRARGELAQLFLTERECFDKFRGDILAKLNQEMIVPAAASFRQSLETAKATINGLIETLKSMGVSGKVSEIDKFDTGIISWNRLCSECAGPGNTTIDPSYSVRVSSANLFNQSTFNVVRLTSAIERLRGELASTQRRMNIAATVQK